MIGSGASPPSNMWGLGPIRSSFRGLYQVEDVIAANPGLAALGPVLPSGQIIELPEIEDTAQERPTIRLWD